MYWGIILVSGVAFSCATEFVPEINAKMKLVKFESDFQVRMVAVMVLDMGGCWIIEKGLKALFSDFRAKDIAARRPEQVAREEERRRLEGLATEKDKDKDKVNVKVKDGRQVSAKKS